MFEAVSPSPPLLERVMIDGPLTLHLPFPLFPLLLCIRVVASPCHTLNYQMILFFFIIFCLFLSFSHYAKGSEPNNLSLS